MHSGAMQFLCTECGSLSEHTALDLQLFKKYGHDPVSECNTCLQRHHLSFRNGRTLYRRTCSATGRKIVSNISPDKPFLVYEREYWNSDAWDGLAFGREFDFSRPFFAQYRELQLAVPRQALLNISPENSEFCNMCAGNKNCYLVIGGDYNEDSLYCTMNMRNRSVVDIDYSNDNELSYSLFNSFKCYGCRFTVDSKNCTDCAFVSDCIGCTDCILCTNLANRQHCIENQQLSKDEYLVRKAELLDGTFTKQQALFQRFLELRSTRIVRPLHLLNCQDCSGDYLENSGGCTNCFFAWNCHDLRSVHTTDSSRDSFLSTYIGSGSELCYHLVSAIPAYASQFSYFLINTSFATYCESCMNCKNLLGCNGLKQKQYCILNRQYSREQYEELMPRIIEHMKKTGEWGKFFPKDFSCFAYNETTAHEYWPLAETQARELGFQWKSSVNEPVTAEKTVVARDLPDAIDDIPDDIVNWAIVCAESGKPFKIVRPELQLYRTLKLPLPRLHPDVRYQARMRYMNPFRIEQRNCSRCNRSVDTTYERGRSETLVCEECYLKEIY